ncbi:DUF3108 domain-containing protein [Acetobacteraceae bacterium KSS8]|uniref:DUF3108 domain-containing protein n=1 Tax=Endosaccharibacter trunci TaxID=2812733 RepID=A0ABT1W7U2_9PROT|nr:DUF3108 domain-containing protein [Acetobacteraceae bacterium KSS8]
MSKPMRPVSCILRLTCGIVLSLGYGVSAQAEALHTLSVDYALSSHGLTLVDMQTRTQIGPEGYAISVHTRTVGIVGMLARSDVWSTGSGRFAGDRVIPESFRSAGHSRGANREVRIAYPDGDPVLETLTPPEPDREPVPPERTRGAVDTLAAVVELSRLVARTGRCDGQALVFDGRRLSRLEVTTVGEEAVADAGAFSGRALRCDFVSRQLGGFLRDETRARLLKPLHGSAWLAPPIAGAPVAAVKAVFESPLWGRATLRLRSARAD